MLARRILDVIADTLTLLALAIAGVGHFQPWFEIKKDALGGTFSVVDFQLWHASRSGTALALAALLVGVSLVFNLGVGARKFLVLLMFLAVLAAIGFQMMIYTPYPITEVHPQFADADWYEHDGYLVALISTLIAGVLCLARMGWTMTASSHAKVPRLD